MTQWLKQSTAATIVLGPFVDDVDGKTLETGLTISQADIRLTKNGGTYAQSNNAAGATHMEAAKYAVPLDTTDTNTLGRLRVDVAESGALPVWDTFMVVPANSYESLILGVEWLSVTSLQPDWSISGATVTVKKTDDSTTQFTKTLTQDAAANPIIGLA